MGIEKTLEMLENNYEMQFEIGVTTLLLRLVSFMNENNQGYIEADDLYAMQELVLEQRAAVREAKEMVK